METDAEFPPIISLETDDTTAFLRAARSGNLEKVIEYLDTNLDINTANSNGLNAMDLASKDGHVEIVTELLKRGAKVDAATKKGNTALHIASLAGQTEIVRILIQYGASVNIQSQNGFTPLYMAAQENHDQVVKLLLSNGANQSLATEDGFTPLAVAMQQGHDKVVSVLLENDSKGKVRLPALHIAAKKDDCKAADLLLQNDHKPDVTSKSGFTPLHIAAHYGNEEIARLLIKRGADVNYLAKHNISPLHVAAKWGKNNMVKILLENSASIDAKTRDGLTPLHCAARSGHEEVVSTLLEHEAPISARTKNGLAPLHMASQGDHVDAARVLLYHRAPVDEVTIDYLTSLHVAAHCGHVRVAKLLLDRKADPNARALNGFTPLHIACKKNRIKVVELLLKHGASIESTTESGLTPLHVASFMGCMNIVIFLLQHEANPDVPTVRGETPLHLAARANQTDIIRILLRNGAKVDARAREEQTPLHIASRLGNVDIVMLLLQHGAAVDTTTKDMYTALHIAAKEGQEEVAAILVENHASVKAATKNGFTPLHIAAKYGNMNVAKILLQKDSKLDAQGKNNITPLHLACHYDHSNVANMILEKGASPHLASQNGHTPLHISARKNQMDIASTLLEHGADPNVQSKAGFTPLQLSAQKGHYDMTNLLIEHGADPNHKAKNGLTALHLCAQEDFIRVASVLVKNGANVESETETGYRPIHVAAHFGNLSMIRFLLKHNAQIDVRTNQNYTPLHQAAQQGHAHIVSALLEGNASHNARTTDGLTALNVAQKLGYISVMEVLKGLSYDTLTPDNRTWEEKYKVIAPESLQETSFMSDSDDEGVSDGLVNEQPYRYLTADLMKSLRDDSLPIDVTRDDPIHRQVSKEEKQEFVQSNNYCSAENFDTNDSASLARLHFRSFLVSFLVDARGGAMKGCRHSGIRIIVPPRRATMPIRVTCRLMKPSKVANPPSLMEGEALATRIIEMGPVGASFLGPVLIDVPHFASVQGKEREIIILRSENGETWKEHDNSPDNDDTLFNTPHGSKRCTNAQLSASHNGRITRILTTEFPQYFAIVTRIKQEVHVIGADGGILISSVANHVQAVFPPGALTKKIKVGLQAHVIPTELTAKLLGNCVAVSPVITIEPRRRKFHKPITLTIPVPQAANKGMINQYGGETPTLRLLCSIAGGTSEAQWEDVTGSTPLTFMNDRVSFTTTVSARFWLMDCRNISEVPKMATELYKESLFVPYITNFVIYTKRMDVLEATLRILCMTDGKEGIHTLERQEEFLEIVKSRDVEALDGKDLFIEFSGNLVPVTKSGVQLKFTFKAFRQNRLSFHVKVRDPLLDPVARMMFMRDPKVAKGEVAQQPICVLNIVLPEKINLEENKIREYQDSNVTERKIDRYESAYRKHEGEKGDRPKSSSPSESKFITDILQKEQTDAATIHESFAQKAASPLESVDASYPSNVSHQDQLSPNNEKQTYTEKRKFWEDITRKRENYQRSESELSRTSQITANESDSECCIQNIVSEEETAEIIPERSETMEDLNIPDISECSVAEKAHYFEEQIQKELSTSRPTSKLITQESIKEQLAKLPTNLSGQSAAERTDKIKSETEIERKVDKDDWNLTESIKREKLVAVDGGKFEKKRTSLREDEKNEAKTLDIDSTDDPDLQESDDVLVDRLKDAERKIKAKTASRQLEAKNIDHGKSFHDSLTLELLKVSKTQQDQSQLPPESLKLTDIAQPDLDAHRKICTEFLHHEAKHSHEELESKDRVVLEKRKDDQLGSLHDSKTCTIPSRPQESTDKPKDDSSPSMIPRKTKHQVPSESEAKKVPLEQTETKQELPLEPQVSLARDKFLIEQDSKIYDKESISPSEKATLKLQEESKLLKKDSRIPVSATKLEKEHAPTKIPISSPTKSIPGEEIPSPKPEKEKESVPSKIPISSPTKSIPGEEITSPKPEKEKESVPSKIPISPAGKSVPSEEITSLKPEKEKESAPSKIPISPAGKSVPGEEITLPKPEKEKESAPSKIPISSPTKSIPGEEITSPKPEKEKESAPSKIPISSPTKSIPGEEITSPKPEKEKESAPSKIPISPAAKSIPGEEITLPKPEKETESAPSKIPISPAGKSVPSEEITSLKLEKEKESAPSKIPISPAAKSVPSEEITSPKLEKEKESVPSKIPISSAAKSIPSEEITSPKLEKEKKSVPSKISTAPSTKPVASDEITWPKVEKEKESVASKIPVSSSAKSISSEEITLLKIEKEKESVPSKIPISPAAKSVASEEITSPKGIPEEETSPKSPEDSKPVKKDSRIPISASKVEKEKECVPSKMAGPQDEQVTSPKKEFESRIPKPTALSKGPEKEARKDQAKETLTEIKTTEKLSSQHYQKLTSETTTTTISKTFVAQSLDANKIFEEAETKIKQDTSVVTSRIDHKASTETKQVTSSDLSKEPEKFFKHEQSDHKLREKLSESTTTKETPREIIYDRQLESQKSDALGVEEISMIQKDGKESVDAIAKKSNKVEKDEQRLQSLADAKGTFIQATDSSHVKQREIDAELKIERELDADEPLNLEDEMKRAVINERRSEERTISEAHVVLPSDSGTKEFSSSERKADGKQVESEDVTVAQTPEERQEQMLKELEARNIAETIIESIQTEIAKRSASLEGIKQFDTSDSDSKDYSENTLDMDTKESEVFHDQMADDLMKKFEDIMEKRSRSQSQVLDDSETLPERLRSVIQAQEENLEKISNRGSISVSEDFTKDEESTPYDKEESFPSSSSQPKLMDRDMTMSPSSISDQIELEVSLGSEQSIDVESAKQETERKSGLETRDSVEPRINDESVLDSVPSLEMDEPRVEPTESPAERVDQPRQMQEPIQVATIHESPAFDSLDEICQDRNALPSPGVISENVTGFSFALPERTKDLGKAKSLANLIVRRTESEESVSPSILSPRLRLKELEIKPVNWMIGDEKIEVSETLQPSQAFDKELEEYQRTLAKQQPSRTSSRDGSVDDNEQESVTRSSEDVSTMDSVRETFIEKDSEAPTIPSSKFTVTTVPEQDFESELVENRLDISCQELIDTLQREYEAKTPTEDRDETKYTYDSEKAEKEDRKTPDFSTRVERSLDASAARDIGIENAGDVSLEVPKLLVQDEPHEDEAPKPEKPQTVEKIDQTASDTRSEDSKRVEMKLEQIPGETEPKKETEVVVATRRVVDEVKSDISLRGLKQTSPGKARKTHSDETKSSSTFEPREKASSDKAKKEDVPAVDLSARYAITVLDQAVKKEIAEVKESLEAAKQDLIEELSENSETVFQIKDSPSEFQFKLQPETIPNDLPFLYKAPSFEQVEQKATSKAEGSPVAKPRRVDSGDEKVAGDAEVNEATPKLGKTGDKSLEEKSHSSTDSGAKGNKIKIIKTAERETKKIQKGTSGEASAEDTWNSQANPIAASRSASDVENKEEGITLLAPQPAPRRRPKPARTSRKVTSESDAGSSSGDSSNYQSCDYEIGSGSRPSSSDIEALHSTLPSGTVSEYETALMSIEHSSTSRPTSQEYQSAVSTLSSRESMKSLNSLSSGHLGSIDSTGELSETLIASEDEHDVEKDHIDENLEEILDEDKEEKESDSSSSEIALEDAFDKTSDGLPCRMKRSSEMIFQQIMDEAAADGEEPTNDEDLGPEEETRFDECTTEQLPSDTVAEDEEAFRTDSIFMSTDLTSEAYDKSFSSIESKTDVPEVLVEGVAAQGDAPSLDTHVEAEEETDLEETKQELLELTTNTETEIPSGDTDVPADDPMPGTIGTLLHQASTTSSTSGAMSFETVIEKDQKPDRHSPDSDSFELVDKPDIIDDFVVIEEVGREAEEFDSEGKSISIGSTTQCSKKYDRELENLIAAQSKQDGEAVPSSQAISRNNELFDFESEESPPMVSNADDQYSQSLSDDENFEGSKKWMEMQFQADPRGYDLDYDRGRLEDIKEEEITDFEAGSSRFGSLGSHKGSIGSVGSMRGSYGSATEYDVLAGKKTFSKPIEHDNVSLSSLQEFESLESAVAMENSRKLQCGSQESVNNGSLPRRYVTSRSGHGDDISLSSLKDFEGLEKACREAHLIELRAREEEDLLDHESPENRYKLENLPRPKPVAEPVSATGSFNPSTSGSDDYEKRIMEIDEIIRIAQANVEKFDRQDDTTEDISQIEITADAERMENIPSSVINTVADPEHEDLPARPSDTNVMETSTDSLELEENVDKKHNPLCRSSDSLEMKTTIDFPSLSSDSLNNVRDPRETQIDTNNDRFSTSRRISSDSLEMPLVEQQPETDSHDKSSDSHGSYHLKESFDDSVEQTCSTTDTKITNNGKTKSPSMSES